MRISQNKYMVRVNACPLWTEREEANFAVCVDNPNWLDEKFFTVLEWASQNFKKINIAVADTLSQHNFIMYGYAPDEAYKKALEEGDIWLAKHQPDFDKYGVPCNVVRWDKWRADPEFDALHKVFGELAVGNERLNKLVYQGIDEHLERMRQQGKEVPEKAYECCFDYIVEEMAGSTICARTFPGSCRLYPAKEAEWLKALRTHAIPDVPTGLDDEYYVAFNLPKRK